MASDDAGLLEICGHLLSLLPLLLFELLKHKFNLLKMEPQSV